MLTFDDDHQSLASAEFDGSAPGLLWSLWLRNARPDGSGLRRWQIWIWWRRQEGVRKRVLAVMRLVRGSLEAPVEAWGALQRFGNKTAQIHGVSRTTQFRHLLMLRWRSGVRAESYYKFQMFRPERFPDSDQFVDECGQLLQTILRRAPRTADEHLFLSKAEFRRWCAEKGMPTVQNLLEVTQGEVISRSFDQLPELDLFVKPANWIMGKGVSRWQCASSADGHCYVSNSGCRLSPGELEAFVCRTSIDQGRPYIVQPALRNHSALLGFTNGALATVRLMTVRDVGQPAQPLMAALRMPTGDAVADNFDLGGVATAIDLKSGECGAGIRKKGQYPADAVTVHPDTGQAIPGLKIPWWPECVALACRAHDLIDAQVPVIGWDVAVLEDGPVLVEANHLPGADIAQLPGGFPLGASQFAEVVVGRLRAAYLRRVEC